VLLQDGQFLEALRYYQLESQLCQPMATADPKDVSSRLLMVAVYANIGHALWRAGHLQEGLASLRHGLSEISEMNEFHQNSEVRTVLGLIDILIGGALERRGERNAAPSSYSQAQSIYQSMSDADPQDAQEHLMLSGTENRIGGIHIKIGKPDSARNHYEKALAISEPLASLTPANLDALYNVFESYSGLGDLSVASAKKAKTANDKVRYWNQGRIWYQNGLAASRRIPNRAIISPDGFESRDPKLIAQRLIECEAALTKLAASAHR